MKKMIERFVPIDLQGDVERSLHVPQVGPYHQEGPFMENHLSRVMMALEEVYFEGLQVFVPQPVRSLITGAIQKLGMDLCRLYILLHDLDKANCLTIVYIDGNKVAVTWDEWTGMFDGSDGDSLATFCLDAGIEQISYYQDQDGGSKRSHGRVTAERLRGREDIPDIVVKAIEEHELAFTFGSRGGINIPLVEKMVEGKDKLAIGFTLLVNYADQMGSAREDGEPDVSDFLLMVDSYLAYRQLGQLKDRLSQTDRLDDQKVNKALAKLRKATDAFCAEDVDRAYSRIVRECRLPELTQAQVMTALEPAISEGLSDKLIEAIVAEMTSEGKLSRETGKALGRFNRLIRPALAKLGK